jgi:heme/copper-type cytochrome/quinol oxidase subunit 2
MSLVTELATVVAETEHHGNVAMETLPFGIIAIVVFGALALVTVSYRNVSNRHAGRGEASHGETGHGH